MDARSLFKFVASESSNKEVPLCYRSYMTLFQDHKDGAANVLNQRSVLRMRVEKAEVP